MRCDDNGYPVIDLLSPSLLAVARGLSLARWLTGARRQKESP